MTSWRRAALWASLTAAGMLGIVHLVWFDVWVVPAAPSAVADSLAPQLLAGDIVLVSRRSASSAGTLVRCTDPDSPQKFVSARVQGVAGDRVAIVRGHVQVNGKEHAYQANCASWSGAPDIKSEPSQAGCELEGDLQPHPILRAARTPGADAHAGVEPEKLYLVSDNRAEHADSRDFGQLARTSCAPIVYRLISAHGFSDAARRLSVIY